MSEQTSTYTPGPWRYEPSTKTIRAEPSNYWLASMDSWDGAVCHEANARLIAAAPAMRALLESLCEGRNDFDILPVDTVRAARALLEQIDGGTQ